MIAQNNGLSAANMDFPVSLPDFRWFAGKYIRKHCWHEVCFVISRIPWTESATHIEVGWTGLPGGVDGVEPFFISRSEIRSGHGRGLRIPRE